MAPFIRNKAAQVVVAMLQVNASNQLAIPMLNSLLQNFDNCLLVMVTVSIYAICKIHLLTLTLLNSS